MHLSQEVNSNSAPEIPVTTRPFPLVSLLRMYCLARRNLYLDNMAGMKLLTEWLRPQDTTLFVDINDFPYEKWFEANYEVHQLAKILHITPEYVTHMLKEIYYGCT